MKFVQSLVGIALVSCLCASASAAFLINEIDADTPGTDAAEFIELKGDPNESADGLVVVLYDGAASGGVGPKSYLAFDLSGLTADANGYILIANSAISGADVVLANNKLQNGNDAVVLYTGSAASFPTGTLPTTSGIVDVLVYKVGVQGDIDWSGLGSPPVYNEGVYGNATSVGLSRIPDGNGGLWVPAEPTPRAVNSRQSGFSINQLDFPRMNQATAVVPTSKTITLKNTRTAPLTVSSFQLEPSSSTAFTYFDGVTPALPVTLQFNQSTTLTVQFVESDVSTNKSYSGSVTYATDGLTSPSGSIEFATELVRGTPALAGSVKINEICYNPGTVDHNNDGSTAGQNDEFVEIFNMTAAPILIEGWEQRCKDSDSEVFHSYVFPEGATLPAGGFVTVFSSGNPTGFIPGTTFTYTVARIRNAGSLVGISDGTQLLDGVAFLGGEDSPDVDGFINSGVSAIPAGGSLGRRPDGSSTIRTFSPTDLVPTDRPTPNTSNDALSGIAEWSLFN